MLSRTRTRSRLASTDTFSSTRTTKPPNVALVDDDNSIREAAVHDQSADQPVLSSFTPCRRQ